MILRDAAKTLTEGRRIVVVVVVVVGGVVAFGIVFAFGLGAMNTIE